MVVVAVAVVQVQERGMGGSNVCRRHKRTRGGKKGHERHERVYRRKQGAWKARENVWEAQEV
jgi:hypothetical protein